MRQELYIPLRDKIAAIVPEIMELKFGCKVRSGSGIYTLVYKGEEAEQKIYTSEDNELLPYGDTMIRDEILGRDIQLADVLRAMQEVDLPDDEFLAAYPHRDTRQKGFWLCHKKERDFDMNRDEYVISSKQWNLALPLRLQEDAVGEWLITVIK